MSGFVEVFLQGGFGRNARLDRIAALSGRVSFRRFCGLTLEERTRDETTLCRFRLSLVEAGLGEVLFAEVSRRGNDQ